MNDYDQMLAGARPPGCTCEMVRPVTWSFDGLPEPAEWQLDPLCAVHEDWL